MEEQKTILVFRDGKVYRTNVLELSSVFVSKEEVLKYEAELDLLSANILELTANFPSLFYSNSEMKSEFVTNIVLKTNLRDNGEIVLSSAVNSIVKNVKTSTDINNWYEKTSQEAYTILKDKGYHPAGAILIRNNFTEPDNRAVPSWEAMKD